MVMLVVGAQPQVSDKEVWLEFFGKSKCLECPRPGMSSKLMEKTS